MATWNTTANDITWTAVDDPSVTWSVQLNPNVTQVGGATTLDGLSDVVITAAASGDILRHNGANWVDTPGTTHFDAAGTAAALVDGEVLEFHSHNLGLELQRISGTTTMGRSLSRAISLRPWVVFMMASPFHILHNAYR